MGWFGFIGRKAQLVVNGQTLDLHADRIIIGQNEKKYFGSRIHTNEKKLVIVLGGRIDIARTAAGHNPSTTSISRSHAVLEWEVKRNKYTFEDLGSTYGSLVNSEGVTPGGKIVLNHKDTFSLGKTDARHGLVFEVLYPKKSR